jgi:hypothetical protein
MILLKITEARKGIGRSAKPTVIRRPKRVPGRNHCVRTPNTEPPLIHLFPIELSIQRLLSDKGFTISPNQLKTGTGLPDVAKLQSQPAWLLFRQNDEARTGL